MPIYKEELEFGLVSENNLKNCIQNYFQTSELIKLSMFHPFDFVSNNFYFEIKTRRNELNLYPSTLIGYNKFEFAETVISLFKKCYFIFQFTDGLYYYEYKQNDINIFRQKYIERRDRKGVSLKNHILLDNDKLTKII